MPRPEEAKVRDAPLASAFVALLLFGSVPACVRAIDVNPYTIGVVRLGLAAAFLTLIVGLRGKLQHRHWSARTWLVLAAVGVAFGIHWLTYFLSIKMSSASLGALGFSTYGTQLTLLGWLLGLSAFNLWDAGGVVLAAVGSLLVFPDFDLGSQQTLGLLLGILSGFFYALLPILHQRHARLDGGLRTWAQFAFALPVFLVFLPATNWHIAPRDWLLLLYLSLVITVVGHGLWIRASTLLSTTTTSVISYLDLPIAMAASWFFLSEEITPWMMAGGSCIVAGNLVTISSQLRRGAMRVSTS